MVVIYNDNIVLIFEKTSHEVEIPINPKCLLLPLVHM